MGKTTNLGLHTTATNETSKTFLEYRTELSGTGADSNMNIIDKAYGDMDDKIDAVNDTLDAKIDANKQDETTKFSTLNSTVSGIQSGLSQEVAARTSEDQLLNTRIDELVAPSGEAPSAAEVQDARVGVDSTTYASLGAAIRGQVGNLKSDIKSSLDDISVGSGATLKGVFESFSVPSTTWSQGSIGRTTGVNMAATNRLRTFLILTGYGVFVEVPAGYGLNVYYYTSNDEESYSESFVRRVYDDWQTETVFVSPVYACCRFTLRKDDDSDITPETASLPVITRYQKSVNARIDECNMVASAALEYNSVVTKNVTDFIQGSISATNGTNLSATNRVRAKGYFQFLGSTIVKVTVKDGYKVSGRIYSGNPASSESASQVYEGYLPAGETATFSEGTWYFKPNPDMYYRFVLAYTSDAQSITPEDVDLDALTLEYYLPKGQHLSTCINTFCGNVSIRAAKTLNFNDGTPPVVDWYLLQDTNNNFYRSKDLRSMEYLFTFDAPSSTVSNWSCGITAYDDVIFVKDAAGYTDSDGPRLDDAKRVNPWYFLGSEGYSTVHELDFGSSFRPAGWLTNVGWSILPNGDVIFCEYTRGTLATCNVWRISGNIENPSSWHRTWSHAIVDSTSGSEPEMKHCHCVQYDFYSGIAYFSTGDGAEGSYIYYSTDNGATWTLLYGPNRDKCRQLNFAFTPDKIYWASDSYEDEDKHFFIAERTNSGLINVQEATSINLPFYNYQACYGCVYIQELNLVLMMDRSDRNVEDPLVIKAYDISTSEIVEIARVNPVGSATVGFRTKYIDWYPSGNMIPIGFNPQAGSVTADTNQMAVSGNQGGKTGDGSTRVNSILFYIYKTAGSYSCRFAAVPLKGE